MSEDLDQFRRWTDSGGSWQVLSRTRDRVDLVLLTCDRGERMGRIVSTEPDLLAHLDTHPEDDPHTPEPRGAQ